MCLTRSRKRRYTTNAQLRDVISDALVRAVRLLELADARTNDCGTVLALVDAAQAMFEGSVPGVGVGNRLRYSH